MQMKVRKAIIPAAGLGTRFLPASKAQPKEMLPVVDKPAIQYIVEEAIASGIEDIMIVTGRNKRAIEDHFDKSVELEWTLEAKGNREMLEMVRNISNLADIHYIRQKEPLGLGHAVLCARKFIGNEPFAVLLGDDIIVGEPPGLKQMIDSFEQSGMSVIGVQQVPWEEVHRYGIVQPDDETPTPLEGVFRIKDVVEKPDRDSAPSNFGVIGRYILHPGLFDVLSQCPPGRGGEIQLTDALRIWNREHPMLAQRLEGRRYDVGEKLGLIEATIEMALEREELSAKLQQYLISLVHSRWK
jgi:UTP--glucose-1-phosphate uridylyltransferase